MSFAIKNIILLSLLLLSISACSQESTVELDPASSVAYSLIQDIQLSDTSDLSIDDCRERLTAEKEATSINEGDNIPANALIFIDFDEVYVSSEDFPVESVCGDNNYGLFISNDIFKSPNVARVWSINRDE